MKQYLGLVTAIFLLCAASAGAAEVKLWDRPSEKNKQQADYHAQQARQFAQKSDIDNAIIHQKKAIEYGYKDPFNYGVLGKLYKYKRMNILAERYFSLSLKISQRARKIAESANNQNLIMVLDSQIKEMERELALLREAAEKPPEEEQTAPRQAKRYEGLMLEGIIWDEQRPLTIINGKTWRVGGVVEGYRIIEITPKSVVVEKGSVREELMLEEGRRIKESGYHVK